MKDIKKIWYTTREVSEALGISYAKARLIIKKNPQHLYKKKGIYGRVKVSHTFVEHLTNINL